MSTALTTLAADKATMRWREPYVSDGLNRKLHGPVPRGIVRGGNLVASLAVLSVEIVPDPVTGDSVYTYANVDGKQLTVREVGTTVLSLNTGGIPGTTVYIGLEVDYTTGADTEATWRAYPQAEIDADEKIVVIGKVVVPPLPAVPIPAANVTLDRRRDAWQDMSVGMRDWRQIVEGGSVDLPVPGKAADRLFPYFLANTTGSATVENSDVYKRSKTHSFRFGGTGGYATLAPHAGDGINSAWHPIQEGQRILYSLYVRADNWTYDTQQSIGFSFRGGLSTGGSFTQIEKPFTNSGTDTGWVHVTGVVESPYDGWFWWSIVSNVDAGNVGYLYLDDIRVWKEVGEALEDDGQRYVMGVNRQIDGSTLALFPAALPDDEATWADSTIRLFNNSPADGSAVSAKWTIDPLNEVDLFDLDIRAAVTIPGGLTVDVSWLPGDVRAIDAKASGYREAIRGVGDDSVSGISEGILGLGGDDSTVSIGVEGVGGDDASSMSAGVYGWSQMKFGLGGLFAALDSGVGVLALGAVGLSLPPLDDTEFEGAGAVGMGDGSEVPSYYAGAGRGAGLVGFGGDAFALGIGVVGYGYEGDSSYNGECGGYFRGGDGYNPGEGLSSYGGDALGTDRDGGDGGVFSGGDADGTGRGGYGGRFYGGDGYEGGTGVLGEGGDGYYSVGVKGIGEQFGGVFENPLAGRTYDAVVVNSGIRFYQGNSEEESQNTDSNIGLKNTLKATLVPKAWASINCAASPPTVAADAGANIQFCTWPSSNTLRVYFNEDMEDNNTYAVVATAVSSTAAFYNIQVYDKTSSYFELRAYDAAGNPIVIEFETLFIDVIILGRQPLINWPSWL